MKFTFNHFNFNVLNMQRSLEFYEKALGLHIARKHTAADGSFQLIYPVSYTHLSMEIQADSDVLETLLVKQGLVSPSFKEGRE